MELIRPEDLTIWTPYSKSTPLSVFQFTKQRVQDSEVAPYISDEALSAILALDRESAADQALELYSFWKNYVRPYVANCIFLSLTQTHGYNSQANGFVKFTDRDNTSAPIDRAERGDLVQTYKGARDRYLNKMLVEFEFKGRTFDGVKYTVNSDKYRSTSPSPAGVNPIGNVNQSMNNRKFRL